MLFSTGLARAFQQPIQCGPFIRASSTPNDDNDAVVRRRRCQLQKVIPVAGQEKVPALVCKP